MWPWEETPRSVAHGILDDETYDWLAIVKGIMEDHKGKVSVTSTLGQGTEFILEFPLSSHMDTTSQSHT